MSTSTEISADSDLTIALNDGKGAFVAPVRYAVGGTSLFFVDVNADGQADVVVDGASVLLSTGNRTFTPGGLNHTFPIVDSRASLSPHAVAVGDFDGDGLADLITAAQPGAAFSGLKASFGTSTGSFAPAVQIAPAVGGPLMMRPNVNSIAIADVNGDGRLDLAATYESGVDVLLNVTPPRAAATPDAGIVPSSDAAPVD